MNERIRGNDKGSLRRHLRALAIVRYRAIVKAMPPHKDTRQAIRRKKYAWFVLQHVGRRTLARVVWPWTPRPLDPRRHPEARVMRGRLSNPTALR